MTGDPGGDHHGEDIHEAGTPVGIPTGTTRAPDDPDRLEELLGGNPDGLGASRLFGTGPEGSLPIDADRLRTAPSGDLFGLTQNAGMGWRPELLNQPEFLIAATQGGLRGPDGEPLALGYHTGHWEIGLLVQQAAATFRNGGATPFSVTVSDPCDGRSQGTSAMFDSLPYRNDAAITLRRLIRSLPSRRGTLGIATCDKGLPAMLLALAGTADRPAVVVPGGVTLPAVGAEDAGTVQTIGARFSHDLISLEDAAAMGCRACGSPGGGCQFLGTAATAQVVAEALGMTLPHSALAPSGEPVWLDGATRSARALIDLDRQGVTLADVLDGRAVENAMLAHAAFGGSTNLLLHMPALAHAAGLAVPTVSDWQRVNRATPRLVDALPNGPRNHPTVQVFMAGGVPEVLLWLRRLGLVESSVQTVAGVTLDVTLDWWEHSERRWLARRRLQDEAGVDPDHVIMGPDAARSAGLTSTVVFPSGNVAPEGSVVKATAIDPAVVDDDGVYRHTGPARVFTSERDAVAAIKGQTEPAVQAGDVVVMIGGGPLGTGMEETYQVTSALKFLPWGRTVPVVTDARFSGVSTGPCIGHVGPEALADGPIGRLRDGDEVAIVIDRTNLTATVDVVSTVDDVDLTERPPHPGLSPAADLPADTRLWALLQQASGGVWRGSVYDPDRIAEVLERGLAAMAEEDENQGHQT